MSQFCTMTTRERQLQAAAICREVQGPGGADAEMDLGRKACTPKDIMLEELSLTANRGSRLFKMRQRRSEKYTFESVRNDANTHSNNEVTPQVESQESSENQDGKEDNLTTTPEPITVSGPDCIAPGYGGPLKDVPPERFNSTAVPRSYQSPWGQAVASDPALTDSALLTPMPDPEPRPEAPRFKSFNRVATPFGCFSHAPRPAPRPAPKTAPGPEAALPDYPELRGGSAGQRPTFNRTALGWVTAGGPLLLSTGPPGPAFVPESDDL